MYEKHNKVFATKIFLNILAYIYRALISLFLYEYFLIRHYP